MCGILGVLRFDGKRIDENLLTRMRDCMLHRGPDDGGLHVDGQVGLAHRRLSIIDLTPGGHQPMLSDDNNIALVFNGEIFNYLELRKELIEKGHVFRSNSDTEVIIHQYLESGEACVEKFNGMFAFALWDKRRNIIFAARDRLGIKPLYYFKDAHQFIIASEYKAMLEDPEVPRIPDYQGIADYFFAGHPLGDKSMFNGISQVEPGHAIVVDAGAGRIVDRKYWDIRYNYDVSRNESQVVEELTDLLQDAIKIHCRSDAPLGCHLSGGMDTSLVTALSARYRDRLKVFSIKFSEDEHIDESRYAKAVARHVDADYHESASATMEIEKAIPYLAWYMERPISSMSGYNYYAVSESARDKVKVTLTGHGGDEIFAGYPAQFKASFDRTDMFIVHSDPDRKPQQNLATRILQKMKQKNARQFFDAVRRRMVNQKMTFEDTWIMLHCGALPDEKHFFHQDYIGRLNGYSPRHDYLRPIRQAETDVLLDKCLYHDIRSYLPGLLHVEDRASMAVSIESRVPLLDYRIVEYLATVSPDIKIKGYQPKYLMRRVAESILPKEVWQRKDKRPFPMPARFLSSSGIRQLAEKILLAPQSLDRGIIRPRVLKEICQDPHSLRQHQARQILSLELWFQIFVDNNVQWRKNAGI